MRRLYRSRYNKKISGVCGGLGNYFRIDPVIVRLLFIFLWSLTGFIPLIIVYLLATMLIPLESKNSPAFEFRHLYRSSTDRLASGKRASNGPVIAGICAGLAHFLKMDPTVLRLIVAVTTFATGLFPMIIAYLVGWFIIPEKKL